MSSLVKDLRVMRFSASAQKSSAFSGEFCVPLESLGLACCWDVLICSDLVLEIKEHSGRSFLRYERGRESHWSEAGLAKLARISLSLETGLLSLLYQSLVRERCCKVVVCALEVTWSGCGVP